MGILARTFGFDTLAAGDGPVGDYSADVTPPAIGERAPITAGKALTLPAVLRSVQITASMAAQLPLVAHRGRDRVEPQPSLIRQPDPWRDVSSFVERLVINLATEGNAFIRKHRADDGITVAAVEALDPHLVTILRDRSTGAKSYRVRDRHTGRETKLAATDVEHLWWLELPGLDRSLSPIQWCRVSLGGAIDVRDYAATWFDVDDVPSGVLSTDQRIDGELSNRYKDAWLNADDAGRRRGPTVRVIGSGLTYSPVALKPADAQWLEAQSFGVLDVARMFGVPGDYVLAAVEGSSLTYQNLSDVDAGFLRTTLFPVYLRKIEAAMSACLVRGQSARFDTADLLRPDAKTRAEIDRLYLDAGVVGATEVRNREGWPGRAPGRPAPAPTKQEVTPA